MSGQPLSGPNSARLPSSFDENEYVPSSFT